MKTVKCFLTRDDFIDNNTNVVADIYELSDYCLTYSKDRKQYTYTTDTKYTLHTFKIEEGTSLTQDEVNSIVKVLVDFSDFVTNSNVTTKTLIIATFTNQFNTTNPTINISSFNYNLLYTYLAIKTSDYISFIINNNLSVNVWTRNNTFKELYPDYSIDIVLPFENFGSLINSPTNFINALNNFNYVDFNRRIEENKNGKITTYTRLINIPYKVPNTTIFKDCYFAFNIYGQQGNYEHILRLELYDYLKNTFNLSDTQIQSYFPSILQINEFFITPKWLNIAIPSHVGQAAINSQISLAYTEEFNLDKFIKIYNTDFLRTNTYSVPFDYNNILLLITNGYYTESSKKDFRQYYPDLLTVTSLDPDFGRMSTRTQNFITLLENMLVTSNTNNSTELLNNVISNTNYNFRIINRQNIDYLSIYYDSHQYYLLPKYEYIRLNV